VAASQCRRPLTSRLLISSSPTKLPTCAYQRSTDNAPPPTFTHAAAGLTLNEFGKLSVDDVTSSVRQLPDKSSAADPILTFVLKQTIDLLAPFIVHWRLVTFLAGYAFITPLLSRRRDLIPLKPVLTGPSLIFQFYQSSWNDSLLVS